MDGDRVALAATPGTVWAPAAGPRLSGAEGGLDMVGAVEPGGGGGGEAAGPAAVGGRRADASNPAALAAAGVRGLGGAGARALEGRCVEEGGGRWGAVRLARGALRALRCLKRPSGSSQ